MTTTEADCVAIIVEQLTGVNANSTLQVGKEFVAGIYVAEVRQASQKSQLKLIKF